MLILGTITHFVEAMNKNVSVGVISVKFFFNPITLIIFCRKIKIKNIRLTTSARASHFMNSMTKYLIYMSINGSFFLNPTWMPLIFAKFRTSKTKSRISKQSNPDSFFIYL